ncbi:Mss4-like protein [Dendryphion nanum]|uniref:Mss4-like protein n=1 Tax=Dendryphion nanum TaxID=256645 RepID=A0A9P9DBU1_9PLEO|nr:Mss4-like protein [Dendryphion nanum]
MSAPPKPKPKAFPAVSGGCYCQKTRYRILSAPLFCHACHCPDCQRRSGSAFACFATIEADRIITLPNSLAPKLTSLPGRPGIPRATITCAECGTELWGTGIVSSAIADVRIGTLDLPTLMEPDVHCFVGSKVRWVGIPEGARTMKGDYDMRTMWPKESLRRFDEALRKEEEKKKKKEEEEEDERELDKTPTAQSPSAEDVEFERRCDETEKGLLARLEKLTIKLAEQEKGEGAN